jgi:addiction module HigA family antidote
VDRSAFCISIQFDKVLSDLAEKDCHALNFFGSTNVFILSHSATQEHCHMNEASFIPEPMHPGLILLNAFMTPYGITVEKLSKAICVPPDRVRDIIAGRRGISPDSAIRLGKYFGSSGHYWLFLQTEFDLSSRMQMYGNSNLCAQHYPQPENEFGTCAQISNAAANDFERSRQFSATSPARNQDAFCSQQHDDESDVAAKQFLARMHKCCVHSDFDIGNLSSDEMDFKPQNDQSSKCHQHMIGVARTAPTAPFHPSDRVQNLITLQGGDFSNARAQQQKTDQDQNKNQPRKNEYSQPIGSDQKNSTLGLNHQIFPIRTQPASPLPPQPPSLQPPSLHPPQPKSPLPPQPQSLPPPQPQSPHPPHPRQRGHDAPAQDQLQQNPEALHIEMLRPNQAQQGGTSQPKNLSSRKRLKRSKRAIQDTYYERLRVLPPRKCRALTPTEADVYRLIPNERLHIDDLFTMLASTFPGDIHLALVDLEVEGLIRMHDGQHYARVRNGPVPENKDEIDAAEFDENSILD